MILNGSLLLYASIIMPVTTVKNGGIVATVGVSVGVGTPFLMPFLRECDVPFLTRVLAALLPLIL